VQEGRGISSPVHRDEKRLENFEILCWRRVEKISLTDRVGNEEILLKSQGAEEYPT
jgi:hypothetical protein